MGVDLTDRKKEVMELFMDGYFNIYDPSKVFLEVDAKIMIKNNNEI